MAQVVPLGRLPKKEAELFRTVVTNYEQKQYKKGIKTADTILKKFPNHGETLSMKGLILNCMNKKTEAYEFVKNGLRNDVRSHICWHVYGLLHRSDNNYKEASKCYLNALKIDTENQNILRDLSWLQVQMRDIPGFIESRKKILDGRPNLKASWIAYAVANYVGGNYKDAFDTIKKFGESNYKKNPDEAYEESELLLFQNKCLEQQGLYVEAIAHLHANKGPIVDKLSWNVKHAELLLLSGQFAEAKAEWSTLVREQPDNYRFHTGFQAAHLELSASESTLMFGLKRLELPSTELRLMSAQLDTLRTAYDQGGFKSKSLEKIRLTLLSNDSEDFRTALSAYMRRCLKEGMPALHHDICSLIRIPDPFNANKLMFAKDAHDVSTHPVFVFTSSLVAQYIANLKQSGAFEPSAEGATTELSELPSALLWALYLQCHLLELSGKYAEAVSVIEECVAHTPTAIDMYAKKARLLKKQGDLAGAAVTMDECRMLDLQDRYLNNKTTKYFLRADEMEQAMATIALFTKHDGDPQKILYDLQCNWYELEAAESYARSKQWGPALKKFYAVKKHFGDHYDDMFDFHGYCIRKTTLRAYQDILTMQDNAYTHKFYLRAVRGVLRIYTHLLENPEDVDGLGHLTPADRKKERARVKKQKQKEQKAQEEKEKAAAEEERWNGGKAGGSEEAESEEKKDTDPLGEALLTKDFLSEAGLWCSMFSERIDLCDSETLAMVADINIRRGKYLQVVRALRAGLAKDPLHPDLNAVLVKVVMKMKAPAGKRPTLNATTATVVREVLAELLSSTDGLTVGVYVTKYAESCKEVKSLPHLLAAAKCLYLTDKSAATVQIIAGLLGDEAIWSGRGITLKNVTAVVNYLQTTFPAEAFAQAFKAQAQLRFPLAAVFQPLKEQKEGASVAAPSAEEAK